MKLLGWLFRQLYRIRTRLLLINALIVAVPLLGVGFARFYEREMLQAVEGDMIHQSQVVAELVADIDTSQAEVLRRAAHQTTTRLRLVDSKGMIVADSAGMSSEQVGDRREIRRALAGHYGASTRVVESRGLSVMFTAVPIIRDREVVGAVYASRSTTSVQVAMRRLRQSIFKVLFLALFATAILTLFLATTVSRPLAALAKRARRFASGDRTVKLTLGRRDEIGELARALDEMAAELEGRSAETAELAANISHELKSPLTSMRGAAELLLDGAANDPEVRARFLSNILCDVDRLDQLVSRILELSRAQSDSEAFAVVDLGHLTDAAARSLCSEQVSVELPKRSIAVLARETHLRSAIRNLVENALTHGRSDGVVAVRVVADSDTASISVRSEGEPIASHLRDRIWTRFYTTAGSRGGTGLGLPIVAAIARAHGGSARLVSSDGAGTEFEIAVPRASRGVSASRVSHSSAPRSKRPNDRSDQDEEAQPAVVKCANGARVALS